MGFDAGLSGEVSARHGGSALNTPGEEGGETSAAWEPTCTLTCNPFTAGH